MLSSISYYKDTNLIYSQTYQYDKVGNITEMRRFDGEEMNMVYDSIYQLKEVGYEFGKSGTANLAYSYDANGNRKNFKHDFGGITYKYQPNYDNTDTTNILQTINDSLQGTSNLTHDFLGNLHTQNNQLTQNQSFTYNLANELTQYQSINKNNDTTIANYFYDVKGKRIKKQIVGGLTKYYIYEGSLVLCDFEDKNNNGVVDGDEGWTYHLYYGLKKIADIDKDGNVKYFLTDHLGTVNAIADKNGNITQRYIFGPFGNLEYSEGSENNSYLYTGKEYDAESGLYYFGARYYDPKKGRWLSRDPKEEFFSSYVYCGNNPFNFIDPDGNQQYGYDIVMGDVSKAWTQFWREFPGNEVKYIKTSVKTAGVKLKPIATGVLNQAETINNAVGGGSLLGAAATGLFCPPLAGALLEVNTATDLTSVVINTGKLALGEGTFRDVSYSAVNLAFGVVANRVIEKITTSSTTQISINLGFNITKSAMVINPKTDLNLSHQVIYQNPKIDMNKNINFNLLQLDNTFGISDNTSTK